MQEENYLVEKSKILEAAKRCSTTKQALKILFPKAFEGRFFKSGTIFYINADHSELRTTLSYHHCDHVDNLKFDGIHLSKFVVLIHENMQKQYRLVHLRTGYRYNKNIYTRTEDGIEIPEEDLNGLEVYVNGYITTKT